MNLVLGLIGVVVIMVVIIDILQTTFFLNGAGFISGRFSFELWKCLLKVHKRIKSHKFLLYTGGSVILVTFLIWGILFLVGFTLIFLSSDTSVINNNTGEAANVWEILYYIGFTATTLGMGDFVPSSPFWQFVSIITSVTGFFLLTLLITYLISLISSVQKKRTFASTINNIGNNPADFLMQLKTKDRYHGLTSLLNSFITEINSITEDHLAYPALHYFHSSEVNTAVAPAVAVLDEALSLLIITNRDRYKEISILIDPTRKAISNLLEMLQKSYIQSIASPPPIPAESVLKKFSYSIISEENIRIFYDDLLERRKVLVSYIENNGWEWSDVVKSGKG